MSKADSGLFKKTYGAKVLEQSISVHYRKRKSKIKSLSPESIRLSQNSVNGIDEIAKSMKRDGWKGPAIDVVLMQDKKLTSLDNTRVLAAREAGINVKANVHQYDEKISDAETRRRFFTPKGGEPTTWGQAVENRIGKQSSRFRKEHPNGAYNIKKIR